MRRLIRFALTVTAAMFLALFVVGVTRASEEPQVVSVTLREFQVASSQFVVNSARPVRFVISNQGELPHRFSVRRLSQNTVTPADAQPVIATNMVRTIDMTLEPGVYSIECGNTNHVAQGMATTIASDAGEHMRVPVPADSLVPMLLLVVGTVFIVGDSMGLRIVHKGP